MSRRIGLQTLVDVPLTVASSSCRPRSPSSFSATSLRSGMFGELPFITTHLNSFLNFQRTCMAIVVAPVPGRWLIGIVRHSCRVQDVLAQLAHQISFNQTLDHGRGERNPTFIVEEEDTPGWTLSLQEVQHGLLGSLCQHRVVPQLITLIVRKKLETCCCVSVHHLSLDCDQEAI